MAALIPNSSSTLEVGQNDLTHIDPKNVGSKQLLELVNKLSKERQIEKSTPIVLGFSAWDAPLFGTFNYWGGFTDIAGTLNAKGFNVLLVKPGPISSNWERACEIYAQLKESRFDVVGAQSTFIDVDYGNRYPQELGYQRRRRCKRAAKFARFHSDWSWTVDQRVHFICHSQGGNTIRYLIHLLKEGSDHSSYFKEKNRDGMVKSVVTVGTPHRGTTVIDVLKRHKPQDWKTILKQLIALASYLPPEQRFYDLQLDHWGFERTGNEEFPAMFERLGRPELPHNKSPIDNWCESKHHGFYDNSIEGVQALNSMAPVPSDKVFYFTMSFSATNPFPVPTINAEEWQRFPFKSEWRDQIGLLRALTGPFWDWSNNSNNDAVVKAVTKALVEERKIPSWLTSIANRNLNDLGYNITLPQPGSLVPRPDILPPMAATCYGMGGHKLDDVQRDILMDFTEGRSVEDEHWHPNDGIVNAASMRGPDDRYIGDIAEFPLHNIPMAKGRYWDLGKNVTMDHADEIGVYFGEGTTIYEGIAELLSLL